MLVTLIEVVGAPALAGAASVAGRRWGPRAGGVVSAFPAIVGPVLLITALTHGSAFAARTANGTLLGLVSLSAFVVGYGRAAERRRWPGSLAIGWACAAGAALVTGLSAGHAGPPAGLLVAMVSLTLAYRALPAADAPAASALGVPEPAPLRHDLIARIALTGLLVFSLSAAAGATGPLVGGMLTALPALASMLAVFTHRQHGGRAATALLRGAGGHGRVRGVRGSGGSAERSGRSRRSLRRRHRDRSDRAGAHGLPPDQPADPPPPDLPSDDGEPGHVRATTLTAQPPTVKAKPALLGRDRRPRAAKCMNRRSPTVHSA